MKIISVLMTLIIVHLYANEKWIKIEPIADTQTPKAQKQETKSDVNLSQIEPINKMMKNISLIQQIIKVTDKKETKQPTNNDKNWFVIQEETQ